MNASPAAVPLLACLVGVLAACGTMQGSAAPPPESSMSDEKPPDEASLIEGPTVADEPLILRGDQPALIPDPTPESRAELERVISDMLFGAEVTLSEDALTKSSVLILERQQIRSNPALSGRDLGTPERFRLLATETGCVLIHETNHARYELTATDCVPEP